MSDNKYGRLFTEQDVRALLAVCGSDTTDIGQLGERVSQKSAGNCTMTFSAGEPLFLLRGQDAAAPNAIADVEMGVYSGRLPTDYLQSCLNRGAPQAHLEAVWHAAKHMRDWQAANPDRVKAPD